MELSILLILYDNFFPSLEKGKKVRKKERKKERKQRKKAKKRKQTSKKPKHKFGFIKNFKSCKRIRVLNVRQCTINRLITSVNLKVSTILTV